MLWAASRPVALEAVDTGPRPIANAITARQTPNARPAVVDTSDSRPSPLTLIPDCTRQSYKPTTKKVDRREDRVR